MKKVITMLLLCASLNAIGQQKQDSLIVRIEMDSTTFKSVVSLITENINGNTTTGKVLLQNILAPIYQNLKLVPRDKPVADKPKQYPDVKEVPKKQ